MGRAARQKIVARVTRKLRGEPEPTRPPTFEHKDLSATIDVVMHWHLKMIADRPRTCFTITDIADG